MARTHHAKQIRPFTEFRANSPEIVQQLRISREPVFLTNRGRPVVVLLDIAAYDNLMDELDVLRDVRAAEAEVHPGEADPHSAVEARLRAAFRT